MTASGAQPFERTRRFNSLDSRRNLKTSSTRVASFGRACFQLTTADLSHKVAEAEKDPQSLPPAPDIGPVSNPNPVVHRTIVLVRKVRSL